MKDNLFNDVPEALPDELFQTLVQSGDMKIERIISRGHSSPEGEWYEQPQNEWVVLLSGAARLTVDGVTEPVELLPGDHLMLKAGLRHRVDWTCSDKTSIWLAVHFS